MFENFKIGDTVHCHKSGMFIFNNEMVFLNKETYYEIINIFDDYCGKHIIIEVDNGVITKIMLEFIIFDKNMLDIYDKNIRNGHKSYYSNYYKFYDYFISNNKYRIMKLDKLSKI